MSYVRQQQLIADMNYYNDPRVRAAAEGSWYDSFDEESMTATKEITHWNDEDEEITEVFTFNVRFEVCDLCHGKGTMVNPSIDAGGLGAYDFHEDPDFYEDYHSGRFDVTCSQCKGKRVVPVICDAYLTSEQERALKIMKEQAEDAAYAHAERMAEMRMGC